MSLADVDERQVSVWDLGSAKFPWWKDWRGRAVAIVASGPSTKKAGAGLLRGRLPVIAIKENVELCPWADVVYGCDAAWWKNQIGLPKFGGLKISYAATLSRAYPDIRLIDVRKDADRLLFDAPGTLGSGGNSGFQAVNLALQFGATRLLLIGFDMTDRSGVHWYGRNRGQGRNNPGQDNFRRWIATFMAAAPELKRCRVDVVNASPNSALTCFRKQTVERTLVEWGL